MAQLSLQQTPELGVQGSYSGWNLQKVVGITVQGGGIIDGRGSVWWKDTQFDDPIDDDGKLIVPLNNTVEENPPIAVIIALIFILFLSFSRFSYIYDLFYLFSPKNLADKQLPWLVLENAERQANCKDTRKMHFQNSSLCKRCNTINCFPYAGTEVLWEF